MGKVITEQMILDMPRDTAAVKYPRPASASASAPTFSILPDWKPRAKPNAKASASRMSISRSATTTRLVATDNGPAAVVVVPPVRLVACSPLWQRQVELNLRPGRARSASRLRSSSPRASLLRKALFDGDAQTVLKDPAICRAAQKKSAAFMANARTMRRELSRGDSLLQNPLREQGWCGREKTNKQRLVEWRGVDF